MVRKESIAMKKLLTITVSLIVSASFTGLSAAQEKRAEEKKLPAVPPSRTYAPGDAHYGSTDKPSPKSITGEITGKVTGVDPMAKHFNVIFQGRAITFSAARLSKLPTVGENINITFDVEPAGLPMATSTTAAGSTARPHIGGKKHCYHPLIPRPSPLISLNVCDY